MRTEPDNPDTESHYLLVRSGGHRCAIPVEAAKLVTNPPEIFPLPNSTPRLLGLAQVAGEPVAVVDLHALLDSEGERSGGHELTVVLRLQGGGASLGLAVEEAFGVTTISRRQERSENDPEWISGQSTRDGRTIMILDPGRLLVAGGES